LDNFNLLSILDAVYWDISFYGGPQEAEEFKEELCRRVDEIKSGEAKLIPFEDIKKEWGIEDEDEDEEESSS
jgi:hypothetical protein